MPSNPSKGWMNIMTNRSNIPITRRRVASEKADAIRAAVSGATAITTENASSRVATVEDAAAFHEFLSDPQIHAPIYTLPRPLTVETVRDFIADHQGQREHGTGLLFLNFDEQGAIGGYSDIAVWPEWAKSSASVPTAPPGHRWYGKFRGPSGNGTQTALNSLQNL